MPRSEFILDPSSYYHVSSRTRNKDWYQISIDQVWSIMQDQLFLFCYAFKVEILAFVLMDNHYHLILRAPEGNLSEAMQYFLSSVSREIRRKCQRENQIWGGRFFRCRLNGYWQLMNCYKYIYRNPVTAGIIDKVENYKFSTLYGLLGRQKMIIPMAEDAILFNQDLRDYLRWLNTAPEAKALESVRRALKHPDFMMPKISSRPNPWAESLI